jgi:Zn-finger nucleic acid-binding protein
MSEHASAPAPAPHGSYDQRLQQQPRKKKKESWLSEIFD